MAIRKYNYFCLPSFPLIYDLSSISLPHIALPYDLPLPVQLTLAVRHSIFGPLKLQLLDPDHRSLLIR